MRLGGVNVWEWIRYEWLSFGIPGCTLWINNDCNLPCCVQHDYDYADGGSEDDRFEADYALMNCVEEGGHWLEARIMFIGVRIFGRFFWRYH